MFNEVIDKEKGYYSDSQCIRLQGGKKNDEFTIGFKDFEFIRFLGQGAYGGVYLVKKKTSSDLYAMKVIDFNNKIDKNNIQSL